MRNRKSGVFRYRSNGRNFRRRTNNNENIRSVTGSFLNDRTKNNFKSNKSAEQLLESYKILAKEAISLGDKTLAENYLQHIDHFERIVSNKNLNQNNNLSNNNQNNNLSNNNQNNNLSNNSETDKDHTNKNKE